MKNKIIFITGAGGLLGKTLIKNFQKMGCFVIASEYKTERLLELKNSFSKKILIKKLDVTNEIEIKDLFAELLEINKFPNVFINNAFKQNSTSHIFN